MPRSLVFLSYSLLCLLYSLRKKIENDVVNDSGGQAAHDEIHRMDMVLQHLWNLIIPQICIVGVLLCCQSSER